MLDGFEQKFAQGLNVLIGGHGTGKSSVIELIRFCLGATSYTDSGQPGRPAGDRPHGRSAVRILPIEIETIAPHSHSRLRPIDDFVQGEAGRKSSEGPLVSKIRSSTR